jgi:replisome organiser protein
MSETGWIKLHRKMLQWEWFSDRNVFHVFVILLLSANREDNKWRGIIIKKGEYLTSIDKIAKNTKLSVAQVRLALNKLKKTNEITIKTTSLNTLISITNWEKYQAYDNVNDKPIANGQQTDNKRTTTNKKEENKEKEKNVVSNEPFFEFFRRVAGNHISDDELMQEISRFKNKYPNMHPNRAGALINTWVANIGKASVTETVPKPRIVV